MKVEDLMEGQSVLFVNKTTGKRIEAIVTKAWEDSNLVLAIGADGTEHCFTQVCWHVEEVKTDANPH